MVGRSIIFTALLSVAVSGKSTQRVDEIFSTRAVTWSYSDVDKWSTQFPNDCGNRRQSPVNIERLNVDQPGFHFPLTFHGYESKPKKWTVTNNGHTAVVTYETDWIPPPRISGGGLPWWKTYYLHSYHFHWGSTNLQGSEHTIDTVKYPLELHLVHYEKDYGSLSEAVKHSDGLAVLGLLFKVNTTDNAALTPLIDSLSKVTQYGTSTTADNFKAFSSFLPENTDKFYNYMGSLTTPTCNEAVVWTVFKEPLGISEKQLAVFRTLLDSSGKPIQDNFRPVQNLNGRKIYAFG